MAWVFESPRVRVSKEGMQEQVDPREGLMIGFGQAKDMVGVRCSGGVCTRMLNEKWEQIWGGAL